MKKNITILTLSMMLTVCTLIPISAALLSPAFRIIERQLTMTMNDMVANGIDFDYDDFSYVTGSRSVKKIIINSLPAKDVGTLYLGDLEVMKNQVIGAESLSMLRFESSGTGAGEATFDYTAEVKNGEYHVECVLYLLDEKNASPTISTNTYCNKLRTYENIKATGKMTAEDEENDNVTYNLTSRPKNGSVSLVDKESGIYSYTPKRGFSGKDSFKFSAEDRYGNRSTEGEITISVLKTRIDSDKYNINGHWAQANIITLIEKNIIPVSKDKTFDPNKTISRTDFLVLCMNACGKDYLKNTVGSRTVFKDESDIPKKYLGYVAEAYSKGYISGIKNENDVYFNPNGIITRQEAAVMVKSVFELETGATKNVFSDQTEIADWSSDAIYTLESLGIITKSKNGDIDPKGKLTLAEAAKIISCVAG